MEKKLFLLDGMALIYRAYFAFNQNPRLTSTGVNTSAAFGFTNTLLDILRKENPTHIGISFDTSAPTERHIEYEAYKAHRDPMPEDLRSNIPLIFKIIDAFNIPMFNIDGYEADDVIGTLAKKASKLGFKTYMMTPDKDFGQLVEENIFMYKPPRLGNTFEVLGVKEILYKWEIDRVEQVIDILGLWGDAADNIPGVPGVGEKTAKKLIQDYDSIENLLQNTHMFKGKLQENLINFGEQALLSKRLATININVPIEFDEKALLKEDPDPEKIKEIFTELEFKTLAQRVLGTPLIQNTITPFVPSAQKADKATAHGQVDLFAPLPISDTAQTLALEVENANENLKTIENTKHTYNLVTSNSEIEELLSHLGKVEQFCFDTETTGLDVMVAELVGLSISFKKHQAWYVPFSENRNECQMLINRFKPFFENDKIEKIGQNIKYDFAILANYGIKLKGKLFDTMLAHYLLEPDQKHGMDILSAKYLGYQPVSITELIGKKGKDQLNFRDVQIEKAKEYASEDADITWQLGELFKPMLKAFACITET